MRQCKTSWVAAVVFLWAMPRLAGAFTSIEADTFFAAAVVGSVTTTQQSLSIQGTALPSQAFFGKNVVIPIQVISTPGPITTQNLSASIVYQLLDTNGNVIGAPSSVPITLSGTPTGTNADTLTGSAIIPSSELTAIQNGGQLTYIFLAKQGGAGALYNANGAAASAYDPSTGAPLPNPLETTIITQLCSPVSPNGSVVSAPDLFLSDGETSVSLAPGAIASQGTLCITRDDTSGWPLGPGGTQPAVVYTITLNDTSLLQSVGLVISYPADSNGNVEGLNVNPNDLGMYWLGPENIPISDETWQVLSRVTVDTTRHTVTGFSGHFSTFALFAGSGNTAASSIRPSQRIITPNGDGINDTISFSGLTAQDEVKIFDIRGRRIRTLSGPLAVWDGKDDDGSIVASGVYIYQYTTQGSRVSGVVMVAK